MHFITALVSWGQQELYRHGNQIKENNIFIRFSLISFYFDQVSELVHILRALEIILF